MADSLRHLHALERAAKEAQRALEASVSATDESWNDDARRSFEAEHLAAIRSDARRLGVELGEIVSSADAAIAALGQD